METNSLVRSLLELISASGGETDTRIRIQKEAFLAAAKGLGDVGVGSFDYYHYGPFSRALSDTLHAAVNSGLVREIREDFDSGVQKYRYKLTDEGKGWISRESARYQSLEPLIQRLAKEHWRTLELAATAVFLERKGKASSREAALADALMKKPETRPYEAEARTLLQEIQL